MRAARGGREFWFFVRCGSRAQAGGEAACSDAVGRCRLARGRRGVTRRARDGLGNCGAGNWGRLRRLGRGKLVVTVGAGDAINNRPKEAFHKISRMRRWYKDVL
ncbi:hypothetical protein HMPREF2976_06240 [Corynebacterium sp. HMSC077D10]|nr:hypothetical protein HMPREF2998_12920 [Corynebacterium sp. HMSC065A05]OFP70110.1 hypothetical protein HMPREF2976_06240 [Corynebacterium sp. HMSC077D10]